VRHGRQSTARADECRSWIDRIDDNPQIGPVDERIWAMNGSRPMGRRKTGICLGRWTCARDAPEGRRRNRKAEEQIRRAGNESDSPRNSQSTRRTNRMNTATNGTERTDWGFRDGLPGCSKTVERRDGRSRKEEKRNETKRIERI
jgi:hypothetical protein